MEKKISKRRKNIPMGELLLQGELISKEQLEYALKLQKQKGKKIGDILIELGYVNEKDLSKALGKHLNVPFYDISELTIKKDVIDILKRDYVEKYKIMPLDFDSEALTIATNDPMNFYLMDDIKLKTGKNVKFVLSASNDIEKAINLYYNDSYSSEASENINSQFDFDDISSLNLEEQLKNEIENAPIVKFVNSLISVAVKNNASDVHIEPMKEKTRVRMRIDGQLLEKMEIKLAAHSSLVTRIKIMSGMDIAEKRIPQDGRIESIIDGKSIDLRVSTIPTVFGEKIVIRVLGGIGSVLSINQLGLSSKNEELFNKVLKSPNGIILICGPTGSGKTTTLYSMLNEINDVTVNTITIEDPVEYKIDGVNQVQVNSKAGLTFAAGLRSVLRQDPDIIMIGEIRDSETAAIAVKSAITGHRVLSTIHTNDAVGAVSRLTDMGIEPYLVASSTVGVISQRLVKKLCPNCKHAYLPDKYEMEYLGIEQPVTLYKSVGCKECGNTGYKGRVGIHEILVVDEEIRELINKNVTADYMEKAAVDKGMVTLRNDCLKHVIKGIVSVEELTRATYKV